MQVAGRKLCREASVSHCGMKIPHIEPGSATRVPAGRSAAAIHFAAAQQYHRRQTRCVTRVFLILCFGARARFVLSP